MTSRAHRCRIELTDDRLNVGETPREWMQGNDVALGERQPDVETPQKPIVQAECSCRHLLVGAVDRRHRVERGIYRGAHRSIACLTK